MKYSKRSYSVEERIAYYEARIKHAQSRIDALSKELLKVNDRVYTDAEIEELAKIVAKALNNKKGA